jgi:predicted AAA+ superfamily ATPase
MLNLGDKVSFNRHLIKNLGGKAFEDNEGEPVEFEKRVIKELNKPKEGILYGRRRVGKVSMFQWQEYVNHFGEIYEDGRWEHTGTQYETIYLVACNLSRTYMVRPEHLQLLGTEEVVSK